MTSKKYWIKRTAALEAALQDAAADLTEDIISAYEKAIENINADIRQVFKAYVAMDIPDGEAEKLLNAAESDKSYQELMQLYAETTDEKRRADILARVNAQAYGARISRLEGVKSRILIEMTRVANRAVKEQKTLYTDTLQKSYYTNIYNIAEGLDCGIDFSLLPQRAIDRVLREPWKGSNYSNRIWDHNDRFIETVQETVTSGIIAGHSVNRMAGQLEEYVKSTRPEDIRTSTRTLVRSETAHFMNQGQLQSYKDIGIEKYRFVCAFSENTCDRCAPKDGECFDVDKAVEGKNYPPIHANCRCITVMADVVSKTRLARDPETGKNYKIDGNITFAEWKNSLTDEQREAMNTHVAQMRNASSDKKQYERYKYLLGAENTPKTLEKFIDIKYNNSETWSELKRKAISAQRRISGAVSGALKDTDPKASEHAERYYGLVRKMTTDVSRIAENTGYKAANIEKIKNHVFMTKHDLGNGEKEYFYPDYNMAQSWQRLIQGRNIQPQDYVLLKHECAERFLMRKGYAQQDAHDRANKKYNYSDALEKR